jgi:hypothetical protein
MYVAERKFMRDKGGDIWFREEEGKASLVVIKKIVKLLIERVLRVLREGGRSISIGRRRSLFVVANLDIFKG